MRAAMLLIAACGGVQLPCWADVDCFTLYGPTNEVAYRSTHSPVDLSRSLGDQVRSRWPGHHLVWTRLPECPAVDAASPQNSVTDAGADHTLLHSSLFVNAAEMRTSAERFAAANKWTDSALALARYTVSTGATAAAPHRDSAGTLALARPAAVAR